MRCLPIAPGILANDAELLRELDTEEGLPKLLSLVAKRSSCKRGDILPAWSDYLKVVSKFATPKTFADTPRRRLLNLADPGLVSREGNSYAITDAGLAWLDGFSGTFETSAASAVPSTKRTNVAQAAKAHNEEQLDQIGRKRDAMRYLGPACRGPSSAGTAAPRAWCAVPDRADRRNTGGRSTSSAPPRPYCFTPLGYALFRGAPDFHVRRGAV